MLYLSAWDSSTDGLAKLPVQTLRRVWISLRPRLSTASPGNLPGVLADSMQNRMKKWLEAFSLGPAAVDSLCDPASWPLASGLRGPEGSFLWRRPLRLDASLSLVIVSGLVRGRVRVAYGMLHVDHCRAGERSEAGTLIGPSAAHV